MENNELKRKVNISVREAMGYLYEIHRPLLAGRCGVGTDTYAEAYGNLDVALDAVYKAQDAAMEAWSQPDCTDYIAKEAARKAAVAVFDRARSENLIFLRNGTRSATIIRAYLISTNF